jgi:hypothetical protein
VTGVVEVVEELEVLEVSLEDVAEVVEGLLVVFVELAVLLEELPGLQLDRSKVDAKVKNRIRLFIRRPLFVFDFKSRLLI